MRNKTRLLMGLAAAALLIAAIACDTGEDSLTASDLAALTQYDRGIRVNGTGTVAVAPDIATLQVGVETTAETADEARREASTGMNAIMDALRARGVQDADVQTTQFSIEPVYGKHEPYYMEGAPSEAEIMEAMEYIEAMSGEEASEEELDEFAEEFMAAMMAMALLAGEDSEEMDMEDEEGFAEFMAAMIAMGMMTDTVSGEEIGRYPGDPGILVDDGYPVDGLTPTGYRVTNTAEVKVRDLDAVGAIIDAVVDAGGDAARVDGVWFSAEDTEEARTQAREMAMKDAVARADELAEHAGATRGKLLSASEDSYGGVYYDEYAVMSRSFTAIEGGELEVRVSVYATFAIE